MKKNHKDTGKHVDRLPGYPRRDNDWHPTNRQGERVRGEGGHFKVEQHHGVKKSRKK